MLCALPVMLETETVSLSDAYGRVIAADVKAVMMSPPFDRSPFDGYAFRGEDTAGASRERPVTLSITEEIPAGKASKVEIQPGYAAKILTGAPIPKGPTPLLNTRIRSIPDRGQDFEPAGLIPMLFMPGTISSRYRIAERGTVITASHQGILAARVYRSDGL